MLRSGGSVAWGARHYVPPQVRVTERDASNVSLSAQHPFFVMKGVLLFFLKGVLPVAGALQLLAFTARPNSVWHLARARPFPRWLRFWFGAHPAAYTHVA